MNSPTRQAKLQELIEMIRATMDEIKRAKERDAIFEERKKLFLKLRDLNVQLSDVLGQVNYSEETF
jgi:hypothetical protein